MEEPEIVVTKGPVGGVSTLMMMETSTMAFVRRQNICHRF